MQQINTGMTLIQSISNYYATSFVKTLFDDLVAKKQVYIFFMERIDNSSALILQNITADEYRILMTDMSNALKLTIASIHPDLSSLKTQYSLYISETKKKKKNS